MRKNKNAYTRNPGGKDTKDLEDQDPFDTGQSNYAGVTGGFKEDINKTEDKTEKNDDARYGKIKKLSWTENSS